jgi:hypothetical protein
LQNPGDASLIDNEPSWLTITVPAGSLGDSGFLRLRVVRLGRAPCRHDGAAPAVAEP